jgi:hypothetical protein
VMPGNEIGCRERDSGEKSLELLPGVGWEKVIAGHARRGFWSLPKPRFGMLGGAATDQWRCSSDAFLHSAAPSDPQLRSGVKWALGF